MPVVLRFKLASWEADLFTARWLHAMQLDEIKQALLASYRSHGGINHLDGVNLPSQASVNQLAIATVWLQVPDTYTNPLVEVVYPRFLAGDYVRGNLGMRFGLTGLWSISPVVITLGLALLTAVRILRAKDTVH